MGFHRSLFAPQEYHYLERTAENLAGQFSSPALHCRGSAKKLALNQLHKQCRSRIHMDTFCPKNGKLARSEITKGYEYEEGKYVTIEQSLSGQNGQARDHIDAVEKVRYGLGMSRNRPARLYCSRTLCKCCLIKPMCIVGIVGVDMPDNGYVLNT